jgi:hypothetical protein
VLDEEKHPRAQRFKWWTRKTLAWEPAGPGMIEDLTNM